MSFLTGIFGSYVLEWAIAAVVPFVIATAVQYIRKLGWDISDSALATIERAAMNRAGILVNAIKAGNLTAGSIASLALDLARDIIASNPGSTNKTGLAKNPEKLAEKILAKVPQLDASVVVPASVVKATMPLR